MVTAAASSPVTKVTPPMTIAFAASTRPRRGLAANVVRIIPRRYSVVTNRTARTAAIVSAAKPPNSTRSIGVPLPSLPGAMSPAPVTVNLPATSSKPTMPARRVPSSPSPTVSPFQGPVHFPCNVARSSAQAVAPTAINTRTSNILMRAFIARVPRRVSSELASLER